MARARKPIPVLAPTKATRLSQYSRERAVARIVQQAEEKAVADFADRADTLFHRIVAEAVGGFPALRRLRALPEGWVGKTDNLYVRAGGYQDRITAKASSAVPSRATNSWVVQDADLIREVQALFTDREKHKESRRQLAAKVAGLLNSVSTDKRLYEEAPEIYAQVHDLLTPSAVTAITVPVNDVLCAIAGMRGEERAGCGDRA